MNTVVATAEPSFMPDQRFRPLLVLVAGAACGLLLVELLARLLFPDMSYASLVLRLTNERPTWARPDADFHHVGDGIYHMSFPDGSDPGVSRIMIVGDSFPMGHGVGAEKRFGTLLQQHFGEAVKVDVLAATSYSPVIYRNIIERALSLASYRAIALYVDPTDPVDDLIYQEEVAGDGAHIFDLVRMTERQRAFDAAYLDLLGRMSGVLNIRRLTIYNLLRPPSVLDSVAPGDKYYRYIRLSLARLPLVREYSANPESDDSRKMTALMTSHLDQIVALCRQNQVPLFLFAIPWEFQSAARPRVTLGLTGPFPKENRVETMMETRYGKLTGVRVVPITRIYREHPDPSSLYIDNPGHEWHWNAAGHALAAAVLRQQLEADLADLKRAR